MIWLIYHFILQLGLLATGTFVDLYIWTSTESLITLLSYNLGIFISLPIIAIITAWIIETVGLKTAHIIALLFSIVFAALLALTSDALLATPIILGLFKGVSLGSLIIATDVLVGKIATGGVERIISQLAATKTVASILLPPLIAFVLVYFTSSFQLVFIVGLISFVVCAIIGLLLSFPSTDMKLNLSAAFLPTRATNPEKFLLARTHLLIGVKDGFFFSLLGVIALYFTGNLQGWGIFTFVLGMASLIFEVLYTRYFKQNQSLVITGVGAIAFTLFAVVFVANFNLMGLVFFALGNTLLAATFGISLSSSLAQISSLDTLKEDLATEYALFGQLYENIGRLAPVTTLLALNASLTDPGILEGVIIAISLVPFAILGVISKSFALRHASVLQQQQI